MFKHCNNNYRQAIVWGSKESRLLGHQYMGTEHLLLGILREGSVQELLPPALTFQAARSLVVDIVGEGSNPTTRTLPFTPRSRRAIAMSQKTAISLNHRNIGPLHLMLAIIEISEHDDATYAGRVLWGLNIDLAELKRVCGDALDNLSVEPAANPQEQPEPPSEQALAIKKFISWYDQYGVRRFGASHPVSQLRQILTQ